MRAALDDQQLFDALADEEALRDALADPVFRARLRSRSEAAQPQRSLRWMWWLAPVMAAGLALVFVLNRPDGNRNGRWRWLPSKRLRRLPRHRRRHLKSRTRNSLPRPSPRASPPPRTPAPPPNQNSKASLAAQYRRFPRPLRLRPARSLDPHRRASCCNRHIRRYRPRHRPPLAQLLSTSCPGGAPCRCGKEVGIEGRGFACAHFPSPAPRRRCARAPELRKAAAETDALAAAALDLQVERSVNGRFESTELGALRQGDRVRFRVRVPEAGTLVMTAGPGVARSTLAEAGRTYYLPDASGLPPGDAPVEVAIALHATVQGERSNLFRARQGAAVGAVGGVAPGAPANEPLLATPAAKTPARQRIKLLPAEAAGRLAQTANQAGSAVPARTVVLRLEFKPR